MPQGCKSGTVELHTGIDAVVGGTVWRQTARIIGVDLVKGDASSGSLSALSSRTTEAAIVESHTHCPVGGDRQVGLELIDWRLVIVDLDGNRPILAAIGGSREQDVRHTCAVVLPGNVERIMAPGELVARAETVEDAVAESSVSVAGRRRGDVVGDRRDSRPGVPAVGGLIERDLVKAKLHRWLGRCEGRVDIPIRRD